MEKVPQYNEREPSAQAMTDQEMTPDKETLRCPFCGNNLEFDNGGDFISLICVTCNMELPLRMYENAYCWKELDSLRAENEKLKEENEGNQVWIGRLEKDLEEQCLLLGKSGSREAQPKRPSDRIWEMARSKDRNVSPTEFESAIIAYLDEQWGKIGHVKTKEVTQK